MIIRISKLPIRKGPCSLNKPYIVGHPGPPCNQSTRGASLAPFCAGKNQKNNELLCVSFTVRKPE